MNHLVLTGIATEFDVATGSTSFALVFNGGSFRIPVSEEGASEALNSLTAEDPESTKASEPEERAGWPTPADIDRERPAMEADLKEQAETQEYSDEYSETGPSEEEIAAAVAVEAGQAWQSPNGQLQMDPALNGADIFSADDDYAQPPDAAPKMSLPEAGADDIDDGVTQL